MRIMLAGGGTAGHVNPLLATAAELKRRDPGGVIGVLGTAEGLEARLVPAAGLDLITIERLPLPRRPGRAWLRFPAGWRRAVAGADAAIDQLEVDAVVGFGGYVATPAYRAAHRRGLPIIVHEANYRPGLANRVGARWAKAVATTFAGTAITARAAGGTVLTGLPLRTAIAGLDRAAARDQARAALGLAAGGPVLLVMGGSLGAGRLNQVLADLAGDLVAAGGQVLHLAGAGKAEPIRQAVAGLPGAERYQVREYLADMELAYAAADLALSRAGAGAVSELACVGLPAVLVPLPIGNGEQRLNAGELQRAGGAQIVADEDFTATWARGHLLPLLADVGRLAEMSTAAASVGIRDGAARLTDLIEAVAQSRPNRPPRQTQPAPPAVSAASAAAIDSGFVPPGAAADAAAPAPGSGTSRQPVAGRYHLIGIGGVGMAAVAELLAADGQVVSGSDGADSPVLAHLRDLGVRTWVGHDAAQVEGAATVVYSSAIRPENPELARARALGLAVIHRSQALAQLAAGRRLAAIAGTHGKTTTTAMVTTILRQIGADPSFAIGGQLMGLDSGAHLGTGPDMVIEADESDGSFLAYTPTVAVVTNVEADHLDHHGSLEALEEAFHQFVGRITPGGLLVACADDDGAAALATWAATAGTRVLTYGFSPAANVRLERPASQSASSSDGVDLTPPDADRIGCQAGAGTSSDGVEAASGLNRAKVWRGGVELAQLTLSQLGDHMLLDAAAALLAAIELGVDATAAAQALATFGGTQRRFELRGQVGGVRVVDDYAHHPTEITALLTAARLGTSGRLLVLFQPHLFSRTRDLAAGFAQALSAADEVIVLDVYPAREEPIPGVTGALVADRITAIPARFDPDPDHAVSTLAAAARPGDTILTVGAGDVTNLGQPLCDRLAAQSPDESNP